MDTTNSLRELWITMCRYRCMYVLMITTLVGTIIAQTSMLPYHWQITFFPSAFVLYWMIGCHLLCPIVLNPSIMACVCLYDWANITAFCVLISIKECNLTLSPKTSLSHAYHPMYVAGRTKSEIWRQMASSRIASLYLDNPNTCTQRHQYGILGKVSPLVDGMHLDSHFVLVTLPILAVTVHLESIDSSAFCIPIRKYSSK